MGRKWSWWIEILYVRTDVFKYGGRKAILRFASLQLCFAKIAIALRCKIRFEFLSVYVINLLFFLWQSKKYTIRFPIPLNPSVRRYRRVYILILNFTLNYAMHFSKKTINPTCQCFLFVTFLSRKKSDKTHLII